LRLSSGTVAADPERKRFNRSGLSHSVYNSIAEVPAHEWDLLTADDADLTMDRRLIGAYEATMAQQSPTFTIVIRDAAQNAVALACTCLFRVDAANFPWLDKLVARTRKVWPNCLKIGVLFCGLPIPAGQSHLRIAAHADRAAVLTELDLALRKLARAQRAIIVVVKEFSSAECEPVRHLLDRGYLRGQIPPRHLIAGEFRSFADYVATMKSRYRSQVNRSLKKFAASGLRVEQVRGPIDMPRVYTDQAHRLYEAVQARSKYKLELYPAEFIRELGRQFGDDASLTCIYDGQKLVAFTIGLARGPIYHNLYSGRDYDFPAEADLYFNLFYNDLDFAWRRGAKEVHLGQTSDHFKSRLGTQSEPMYLFVRPINPLVRWGLKTFSKWALPKVEPVEANQVFKEFLHATDGAGSHGDLGGDQFSAKRGDGLSD
jgi:predicted N-acyltransferase